MQSWLCAVKDMPLKIVLEAPMNPTGCYAITDADSATHVVISAETIPHAVLGPPVAPQPPAPPVVTPTPPPTPSITVWIASFNSTNTRYRIESATNPAGQFARTDDGQMRYVNEAVPLDPNDTDWYPTATL